MGGKYFYIGEGTDLAQFYEEGQLYISYELLGAHEIEYKGKRAVRFVVWSPHALHIELVGDFNNWNGYPMERLNSTSFWEIALYDIEVFDTYKYRITTKSGKKIYKADPYAFHAEERPFSGSKYYPLNNYQWNDLKWIKSKSKPYDGAISIYEVNLLSWKRKPDGKQYSYRDLADELIPYVKSMNYTHIELMPIMEHPFDGSWGYQITGYFAPTSRFGTPDDFKYFVDTCHINSIGVILDWVPGHFCKDAHGLFYFDGNACYESTDRYLAENEQWGTANFDYSKREVRNFLISNALYWHHIYHIDGLRVDAVAYMIYLNFSGKDIKNKYGGYENIDAIEFLKELNQTVFLNYPNTLMIAEESTAFPQVTNPIDCGGLGFNYKWNMGWMNDILDYMELDPIYRKEHHNVLTFSIAYAFSENFILPLSHDEVVHGKKSLLDKMPGDYEDKFANLRLLYAYMFAHPGKKLLFMGGEFGQFIEWNEWQGLDWHLLDYEYHNKMQCFIKDLNEFYQREPCLYEIDHSYNGFKWIEHENYQESIIAFERVDRDGEKLIVVLNFTPVERKKYPIGVEEEGMYQVKLHSGLTKYGGAIKGKGRYKARNTPFHSRSFSIRVNIGPLSAMYLKIIRGKGKRNEK